MKVIVCGGRNFRDREFAFMSLDRAHAKRQISIVISGGAQGADELGEIWAKERNIHCAVVKAIWNPLPSRDMDRGAGPKRNAAMLRLNPDAVIAFPGGSGTADMVRIALSADVLVWEPKP